MRIVEYCVAVSIAVIFSVAEPGGVQAKDEEERPSPAMQARELANQNTVTIISGNPNGTYLRIAYDMVAVLDRGDDLRVLAVVGKGGAQNMRDVIRLRGIDMGITQANVLAHFKKTGELGRSIDRRIAYITKLYNEEMHILATDGIDSIEDLAGKSVNFSDAGSGTQLSARAVFKLLGIDVKEVNMGQADAFSKIKAGEIAATVLIAGKPSGSFGRLKPVAGMKLLSVPYKKQLEENYFPAVLTHQDYPKIIPEGKTINTIAVGSVLAVYNWKKNTARYQKVAKFVDAFFSGISKFSNVPRHPKWKEINLAAVLPGWQRFPAAQEWLDRAAAIRISGAGSSRISLTAARREAMRAAPDDPELQKRLFNQFMQWLALKRGTKTGSGAAK